MTSPIRIACTALLAVSASTTLHAQVETFRRVGFGVDGRYGSSIVVGPDLTSDGRPEIIVGAPGNSTPTPGAGQVVIHDSATGLPFRVFRGNRANRGLGAVLALVEDLDGDGTRDIVTGNPSDNAGGTNAGYVAAYSSRTGRMLWERTGSPHNALGTAICPMADFNLDGIQDVAVGMPGNRNAGVFDRVAFLSGTDGRLMRAIVTASGQHENYGSSLIRLPDLDRDGTDELCIGAPGAGAFGGAYYVVSPRRSTQPLAFGTFSNTSFSNMGRSIALMPDLNRDGRPELLIGGFGVAQVRELGGFNRSRVFATHRGVGRFNFFGQRVAAGGDFDGDGNRDYAISAPGDSGGGSSAGAVFIFSTATHRLLHTVRGTRGDFLGSALVAAPDLNTDGLDEWLIGSPSHTFGCCRFGRAFSYNLRVASTVSTVRAGCGTTLTAPTDDVRPGGLVRFRGSNLRPGPGALLLGGPDNVDLSPFGMPTCNLQVAIQGQIPFVAATATRQIDVPIPAMVSLFRGTFRAQTITTDPTANALGLVASNGLEVFIGND